MKRSTPTNPSRALWIAALALLTAACNPGEALVPDEAYISAPTCAPDDAGEIPGASASPSPRFGETVDQVRYTAALFSGPTNQYNLLATVGAPGQNFVEGLQVDRNTGAVTADNATFSTGAAGSFGVAQIGVDLVDLNIEPIRAPWRYRAAGDELLVGDPSPAGGPGSDTGRVHWYHNEYKGTQNADLSIFDMYRWVEGGSFSPASATMGAGFGAAVAAPATSLGTQASFVAVGAPGENAVYILGVDPTWTHDAFATDTAAPFSDADLFRLTPASLATPPAGTVLDFGRELLIDDLNGDGLPELVIGAPGGPTDRGRVFVLEGTSTFPFVAMSGHLELINTLSPGPSTPDDMGLSLASGPLATGYARNLLVMGAPGHASDHGALCHNALTGATGGLVVDTTVSNDCVANPFPLTPGDTQRFAESLAIGNFVHMDTTGDTSSPFALVHELAVGTPGGRRVETTGAAPSIGGDNLQFDYRDVSPTPHGSVSVFRSSGSGPLIFGPVGGPAYAAFVTQLSPTGSVSMDRFGSALVTTDLQGDDISDLLVGSSMRGGPGALFWTGSVPRNGIDDDLAGIYYADDSTGSLVTDIRMVQLDGFGLTVHVADFTVIVRDDTGTICSLDTDGDGTPEFTGTVTISLHSPPIEIDESNQYDKPVKLKLELDPTEVGVAAMTIDATMHYYDVAGQPAFELVFDEPEVGGSDAWPGRACVVVGSPFELYFDDPFVCE